MSNASSSARTDSPMLTPSHVPSSERRGPSPDSNALMRHQQEELERLTGLIQQDDRVDAATQMLVMMLQVQNSNLIRRLNLYRKEAQQLRALVRSEDGTPRDTDAPLVPFVEPPDQEARQEPTITSCKRVHFYEGVDHCMHRLRGSLFDLRREVKRQMEKSCDFIASFKQPLAQCIADIDDDMYALCQDLAKCKALYANAAFHAAVKHSAPNSHDCGDWAAWGPD
uniref:Uncharacterized protein n=1 Tax=Eutreptiella gymnastica TaxID=73025 RepID=A0A7S4G0F2_9EUGL